VVVAAGNESRDVYGPDDTFASFSNYSGFAVTTNLVSLSGKAIDLILPGVAILSTVPGKYGTQPGQGKKQGRRNDHDRHHRERGIRRGIQKLRAGSSIQAVKDLSIRADVQLNE
jgi:hypothetical protein